jgi:hypothetical protein
VYAAFISASTWVKELPCGDTVICGGVIMLGTLFKPLGWTVVTFRCGAAGIGGVDGSDMTLVLMERFLIAIGGLPVIMPRSSIML